MKDLKIYYVRDYQKDGAILEAFDRDVEKLADRYGLEFSGSGVEIGKGIRDIHYIKKRR